MSDENTQTENTEGLTEIQLLKKRADMLGITYSNNIKLDTLKAKIQLKLDGEEEPKSNDELNPLAGDTVEKPLSKMQLRDKLVKECMALVRCRIYNMDPKKKDLHGEIFTVGNRYIGTVRKFIPYGESTENGYHIPKVLFDELKSRKFLHIRTVKDKRTGINQVETKWMSEFNLEVLPQLTEQELRDLAIAQAAAGSIDVGAPA